MDNKKLEMGMGWITQYAILKFVNESNPTTEQIIKFVNENFSILVPRIGDSKYNYITKILVDARLVGIDDDKFKILNEGYKELKFLLKEFKNIDEVAIEKGIKFDM